jgi:hypothetical protein
MGAAELAGADSVTTESTASAHLGIKEASSRLVMMFHRSAQTSRRTSKVLLEAGRNSANAFLLCVSAEGDKNGIPLAGPSCSPTSGRVTLQQQALQFDHGADVLGD